MNRSDALRRLFVALLRRLDVREWLVPALARSPLASDVLVIAFGKAARPMAEAVLARPPAGRLRGLVVPPPQHGAAMPPFEVVPGGHPLPDAGSLRAAARALDLCRGARRDEQVLFLISGGGSSMLELPADECVTLAELRHLYRALIGCGADITAINTVRRHLSAVKGGRLAHAARGAAHLHTFAVSDVPPAALASLASGPTIEDGSTIGDCAAVLDRWDLWPAVPPALAERLRRSELSPPLRHGDELLRRSTIEVLLDERVAASLLTADLASMGLRVTPAASDGLTVAAATDHLLGRLDALHHAHPQQPVAIVTTGELSVTLPSAPGQGGRSQQFALACAQRIAGRPITVMSCGTDGIDGNSPAAGAVVDGSTAARATALGLDIGDHLRRHDAFPLLHALGATVTTGPTGVNVRDVRVLVQDP